MGELFQKERSVITKHINNIFNEGELEEKRDVQILHISGSDRPVRFFSLDVIISVGYRVKSHQGTKFRQWATARLKEYIVKGFTMNDDLLKQAGGGNDITDLSTVKESGIVFGSVKNRTTEREFREIRKRLEKLTSDQKNILIKADLNSQKQIAFLAVCNHYAFSRDFTIEVIRDKVLVFDYQLQIKPFNHIFFSRM